MLFLDFILHFTGTFLFIEVFKIYILKILGNITIHKIEENNDTQLKYFKKIKTISIISSEALIFSRDKRKKQNVVVDT